jgi:phosphoribosylformimino-5-aminoimidazole carboxamide ribotide isomerase
MLIIPAIDILEGKVVRLTKGDFSTALVYGDSPLEQAKVYEKYGFNWVHIIDLTGSKDGNTSTKKILESIKAETKVKIEFGGGVRNIDDVKQLIDIGVDKVILGSLPITDKEEFEVIIKNISKNNIIIASDVYDETVLVKGWQENTNINLFDHVQYCVNMGLDTFLVTDIALDGLLSGPNYEMYKRLKEKFADIKIIASGGVSSIHDLLILKAANIDAAVVGKAIYERKINLKELSLIAEQKDYSMS